MTGWFCCDLVDCVKLFSFNLRRLDPVTLIQSLAVYCVVYAANITADTSGNGSTFLGIAHMNGSLILAWQQSVLSFLS